jgi:NAD(P)H-nitrite reductase large subunit
VTCDRAPDERLGHVGRAEVEAVRRVLDDDVGALGEPARIAGGDQGAALAAVERVEERALAVLAEWLEPAAVVTAARLELDDVGAEVAECQAAERPGDERRELDDADSLE